MSVLAAVILIGCVIDVIAEEVRHRRRYGR